MPERDNRFYLEQDVLSWALEKTKDYGDPFTRDTADLLERKLRSLQADFPDMINIPTMGKALRDNQAPPGVYTWENAHFGFDSRNGVVFFDDSREIQLPKVEGKVMMSLVQNAYNWVNCAQFASEVWETEESEEIWNLLRVHIHNLRSKIEPEPAKPRLLLSGRSSGANGRGYMLRPNPNQPLVQLPQPPNVILPG